MTTRSRSSFLRSIRPDEDNKVINFQICQVSLNKTTRLKQGVLPYLQFAIIRNSIEDPVIPRLHPALHGAIKIRDLQQKENDSETSDMCPAPSASDEPRTVRTQEAVPGILVRWNPC